MGRVTQQKPTKQATATAPGNVRGAKVAKQRKKHKVVLESSSNKDDDNLRLVLSFHMEPPPGYTFIPAGNTQLTAAMKAFAKRGNHKVMAVSATPHAQRHELSREVHRIGYHFPTQVVDQVCSHYGIRLDSSGRLVGENETEKLFMKIRQKGEVVLNEKIRDQVDINTEAKEIIQDLFPTIPNNDLFQIIKTAFQLGDGKVGTADEIPLVRRAQLAVVAHIRHVYTGYDKLLRQVPYNEARHLVEKTTLRKLVEWRGDDGEKDESQKRAVDDAVREVVVLSDEDESESEIEEGQVLENGDVHAGHGGRPAVPAVETHHRPLSPADMSSEDEPPAGYRFVPQVTRTRQVPEFRPDAAARQQSRYAVWNQVQSEYRAGLPFQEAPAHVISRIPLDEPTHSPLRSAYPQPGYVARDSLPSYMPSARYLIDEQPQPSRIPRQESPPLVFRGADGRLYERMAPRPEPFSQPLPSRRLYTPPASFRPPLPLHNHRRSASPNPGRPVYHQRTPSLNENEGNILPSIEGPDGNYSSPSLRRNPFERAVFPQAQLQRRTSDRFYDPRKPGLIDLTDSVEQVSKRRRVSSSPPSPYLARSHNQREVHIEQQENVHPDSRRPIIDLGPQLPVATNSTSFRSLDTPASVAHLSIRDHQVAQSPRSLVQHDGYSRAYEHNDGAIRINRDVRSLDQGARRVTDGVMYRPIDTQVAVRNPSSQDASPIQLVRASRQDDSSHSNSPRYYVREIPGERNIDFISQPMASSRLHEEVMPQHGTHVISSQTRPVDQRSTTYRYEPSTHVTYIRH